MSAEARQTAPESLSDHRSSWRLESVHHLGLTVSDIEQSVGFYRDVLGLTLVRRRPHVDNDYVASQTGYPGVVLNVASFKVSPESPVDWVVADRCTR